MQYSQEHLKTMVYAKFGGQTECIMGNWKIENCLLGLTRWSYLTCEKFLLESHEIKRLAQHFLREYILILFFLAFLIHKTAN